MSVTTLIDLAEGDLAALSLGGGGRWILLEPAGDDDAPAQAAVDDIAAARATGSRDASRSRQRGQERLQHGSGLAAEQAAQNRLGAHLSGHPRHPHALPRGMHVYVVVPASRLDGHAQKRVGSEDSQRRRFLG